MDDDTDQGEFRWTDPETSKAAAKSISISRLQMIVLRHLAALGGLPQNGWEMSRDLKMQTITVVPRLAPLRRHGLIAQVGTRPGPSNRSQIAYIITQRGLAAIAFAKLSVSN
jgi:DNA-binding MarR family transcriptional regulator